MKYRESKVDKELRTWFSSDMSKAFLRGIRLVKGNLRGVTALDISLKYPITAFAGVNGAGKSTILALACCAYHAPKVSFKLPRRKYPYYTFSDFLYSIVRSNLLMVLKYNIRLLMTIGKKVMTFPMGRVLVYKYVVKMLEEGGMIMR